MLLNWSSFFEKLAKFLYRERQTVDLARQLKNDRHLSLLFSVALLLTFGLFSYYLYLDASTWYDMYPQVTIEKKEWQILLDPTVDAKADLVRSDSPLWKSSSSLVSPEIASRLKKAEVSQVWMKLTIPAEKVRYAADNKAYYYRLGFLIGDVKIWLNDQQLVSIPNTYTGNIDIALPIHAVEARQDLTLTINMVPREGAKNLVPLTLGVDSGLVNYKTGASFMKFNHFINRSRPLGLFFVYSLFALIFFILWGSNPVQKEYLHLSAYALVNALPPIMFSDAFTTGKLHDAPAFATYLILVILQAAAGLSLGLAFARSHSRLFSRLIWSAVALGVVAVFLLPTEARSAIRQPLNQILMPAVFFIGAIACFIQAQWLRSAQSGVSQPKRVQRLFILTGILAGLGVLYFVQFHAQFEYVTKQLLFDFPALSLVLFLGYLALVDYRQQSQLVKRIPISSYHRRDELPERVQGAVVMVDLKSSEAYFSLARQITGFESVMPTVLSHMWTAINQSHGAILKAEGDEVLAFFDASEVENPLQAALEAMDRISYHLKNYSDELRSQYDGLENHNLHFRAAIAYGEIRPTWVEGLSGRLPAWVQVGENMVFVEAARLMDIEKQIAQEEMVSRVLIPSHLVEKFDINDNRLQGHFLLRRQQFIGKHNHFYTVDLYQAQTLKKVSLKVVS